MKKQTALTLTALVLFAGGVTFGGIKIKQKKDKDKIEKALNEMLIPDAEHKLDSLQKEYDDVVTFYVKQLEGLQHQNDSLQGFEHLGVIVDQLHDQWIKKRDDILHNELKLHQDVDATGWYNGDRLYNMLSPLPETKNPKTQAVYQRLYYLTSNLVINVPAVPVSSGKVLLKDLVPLVTLNWEEVTTGKTGIEGGAVRDIDSYLTNIAVAVAVTDGDVDVFGKKYLKDQSQKHRIEILQSLQIFLNNIDNSGNVFDEKILQELRTEVKKELKKLQNITYKSLEFKNKKLELEKQMQEQSRKFSKYKSPDIVKRAYKERKGNRNK